MPRKKLRRDTVVDVVALQGPTGTLDGDVRALLAAITERKTYELRRQRLTQLLARMEKDSSLKHRRALVRALWPSVQKLNAHRTELAVMETAAQKIAARSGRRPMPRSRISTCFVSTTGPSTPSVNPWKRRNWRSDDSSDCPPTSRAVYPL